MPATRSRLRRPPSSSGTRTQHASSALPLSSAATGSMISSLSCVFASIGPASLGIIGEGRRRQEPWARAKKSNPRARGDAERPVSWLPAPGLGTTSTIKPGRRQRTAATADVPTRTGIRADIRGLAGRWCGNRPARDDVPAGSRGGVPAGSRDSPWLMARTWPGRRPARLAPLRVAWPATACQRDGTLTACMPLNWADMLQAARPAVAKPADEAALKPFERWLDQAWRN